MLDLKISGGKIIDGTGNPATAMDIGIINGEIETIGQLDHTDAKQEINANGLVVTPGFIDTHTHSDLLCTQPEIHKKKVLQGVTTELLGQDGISVAPVSEDTKPLWQEQLKGLNGDIGEWPWQTTYEYLKFLESSPISSNVLYLVPHGAVRSLVIGFAQRTATDEELIQMRKHVEESMEQGAVGLSSGLIYPPNIYSNKKELIELCKGAAKYDGCFVVHIRNESNYSLDAFDEVIDVARQTGIRLHVSHFKIAGLRNRHKYREALDKMDEARSEGIEVTFDQYPYESGSTLLHSLLPPWAHNGGTNQMLERLHDQSLRRKMAVDMENDDSYDNSVINCGWNQIFVTSVSSSKNKSLEGLSIHEIVKIKDKEPCDVVFDLLIEEKGNVTMVNKWGLEEDVMHGMIHPLQMVGSDGIFGGKPHPRLYGTYPRVLGKYVRKESIMTLPEAIRKMTGAPAQLLRLADRGLIKEGYWADICIFDPKTIIDHATYDHPTKGAEGLYYVIVNGGIVEKDSHESSGMVIKRDETRSTKTSG